MVSVFGMFPVFLVSLLLAGVSNAYEEFDCSKHEILKDYRISPAKSVADFPVYSYGESAFPGVFKELWFLNLCSAQNGKKNKQKLNTCDEDSVICGKTSVKPDLKKSATFDMKIINFSKFSFSSWNVEYLDNENKGNGFQVYSTDPKSYGNQFINMNIRVTCDSNSETDHYSTVRNDINKDTNEENIFIELVGPSGCLISGSNDSGDHNDNDGKNGNDGNNDDRFDSPKQKSSGNWALYLFMYAFLFTAIYLVASSYMSISSRNGSLHDFKNEFIERSVTLFKSCPVLISELWNKLWNRNRNGGDSDLSSSRGGYSAV